MKHFIKILEWIIFIVLIFLIFIVLSPLLPTQKYIMTYIVSSASMEPTIQTGEVVFVNPIRASEIKKGDIVAFTSPKNMNQTILHRIFKVNKSKKDLFFQTKGDNNNAPDNWKVSAPDIKGKFFFAIPLLGHIAAFMKKPLGFILMIVIPALILIILQIKTIKEGIDEEVEKKIKKIFFLLFFLILFMKATANIYAADLNITCGNSGCTPPSSSSIFSSDLWFPLKTETKTINLINNSINSQLIGLSVTNGTTGSSDLSNVIQVKISDNFSNNLYDNSLTNFYTLTEYPLTFLLNSGHDVTYSFQASMNDVGNDWQEKNTSFDMTVGFVIIPTQTLTPTPTASADEATPTNTPGPGPTNTPGPNPTSTPTPLANTFITYDYGGQNINVPVLGAQTSATPTLKNSKLDPSINSGQGTRNSNNNPLIKGISTSTNPWWWIILFVIQIIFQSIIFKKANAEIKKRIIFAEFISSVLFGFIFFKFFWSIIFLIISVAISLVFFIATYKKVVSLNNTNNKAI